MSLEAKCCMFSIKMSNSLFFSFCSKKIGGHCMSEEEVSPQWNLCQDTAAKQVYGTSRLCKGPEALDTSFYAYPE